MLLQHILITIVCCKLLTTSSSGEDSCIEDKTSGHCYQIVDSICKLDGGNLAIIESAEEQTFIADRIRERKFQIGGLWIGSDKVHPEEKRTWINGEKFSYVNWANGQPDNRPDEIKCAVIDPDDGTWHCNPCSNSLGYISENTLILSGNEDKSYIKDINTGHYYKIYRNSSTRATWNTSYDICRKDGGMLIIIESAEEQKFIQERETSRMRERDEAYEQTLEMDMNNVEHVYNRVPDILGT